MSSTEADTIIAKSTIRHALRAIGQQFPWLRRYSGRLGLGRLVAPESTCEQIIIDDDVIIELDLSVPIFRYIYFHHDLSSAPETILMRRLLTPADTCVDVGAHIGYFSLVAAKYACRVIAFEPGTATYERFQRNLQLNPQLAPKIVTHALALSDHRGTAQLFASPRNPDMASLQTFESPDLTTETVNLDTLDHVLSALTVGFIKIDVEGGELDVLNGGSMTIQRDHPIVLCEMIESYQQRFSHNCKDIVDFFERCSYGAFRVLPVASKPDRMAIEPLDLTRLDSHKAENALFIPIARIEETVARLS